MKRRQFITSSAAVLLNASLLSFSSESFAQSVGLLDPVAEIKKLRIPSGTFTGAFLIAPAGRINWYFTNLGILPIIQYLSATDLDLYIRTYLDLYLRRLEANSAIQDINFTTTPTGAFQLILADSDDSYAATTLSVVARYLHASQNWAWWDANKAKLKTMAYRNLTCAVKANGLTSVFQSPRSQTNSIGYLMDNCEVYRGLRDYAALLRERGEAVDANYYDSFANGIVARISASMFDTARSGFMSSDAETRAGTAFYADATCQVFPQAFGLSELSSYYDKAFNYMNRVTPNWQDGRYDDYPWAVLGYVAAKRGASAQAKTQMTRVEKLFTSNRGIVTINELGFYQRSKSLLSGRADI
ncbi:hypothetical protein [Actimicrobium antarcticum]|uniref:Uncharacterized protein n=1 Tax=Actimicrobium antarcticum TaxID=1051899 RepID=A0ABP7TUN5_9BURK